VVEKVGFRSIWLRTLDKTLVIIPNKKMIDSPLENLMLRSLRRVEFDVQLTYQTKANVMKKISLEINEFIYRHKNTTKEDNLVVFNSFGT